MLSKSFCGIFSLAGIHTPMQSELGVDRGVLVLPEVPAPDCGIWDIVSSPRTTGDNSEDGRGIESIT